MTAACLTFSSDGVVTGPEWSVDVMTHLVREMRKASPSPGMQDTFVLARVFHELFVERPETRWWPLLSGVTGGSSLLRVVIEPTPFEDMDSLYRSEEEDMHRAANVARWILQLPQQSHPLLVFVTELPPDPGDAEVPRQSSRDHHPLRVASSG